MSDEAEFPHAPGCFGSALTYQQDAPECQSCAFAAACGPRSQQRLIELRARFNIQPPAEKSRVKKPATGDFYMPVKVAALLARINGFGVDVAAAIRRGDNPFLTTGPRFLAVTTHLLTRYEDGVTRENLVAVLQAKLNWTQGTAAAHALQAVQALIALGVADETNGRLIKKTQRNGNDG